MPITLDPIDDSGTPTSYYVPIWSKFLSRWGSQNITTVSNKDNTSDEADYDSIQDALDYADSEIDRVMRGGVYAIPLANDGGDITPDIQEWAMVIAYEHLYNSRGLKEDDRTGQSLMKLRQEVYTVMAMIKQGYGGQLDAVLDNSAGGGKIRSVRQIGVGLPDFLRDYWYVEK